MTKPERSCDVGTTKNCCCHPLEIQFCTGGRYIHSIGADHLHLLSLVKYKLIFLSIIFFCKGKTEARIDIQILSADKYHSACNTKGSWEALL